MRSHIAILKKPYLDLILTGRKCLECRLTKTACPPFDRIAPGENILLKQSSGPVRGRAVVEQVCFYADLTPVGIEAICRDYNDQIIATADFWRSRRDARYCSLIWLKEVTPLTPYRIKTRGLRAWIITNPD